MLFCPGTMSIGTSNFSRSAPSGTVSAITCVAGVATGTVESLPFGTLTLDALPPLPLHAVAASAPAANRHSEDFTWKNRILRRLTERPPRRQAGRCGRWPGGSERRADEFEGGVDARELAGHTEVVDPGQDTHRGVRKRLA